MLWAANNVQHCGEWCFPKHEWSCVAYLMNKCVIPKCVIECVIPKCVIDSIVCVWLRIKYRIYVVSCEIRLIEWSMCGLFICELCGLELLIVVWLMWSCDWLVIEWGDWLSCVKENLSWNNWLSDWYLKIGEDVLNKI
jgi:hypothetical protein